MGKKYNVPNEKKNVMQISKQAFRSIVCCNLCRSKNQCNYLLNNHYSMDWIANITKYLIFKMYLPF